MPYVIRWPHKRVIALAATSLSLLVAASPAAAYGGSWSSPYSQYQPAAPSGSCAVPQSSSVFSALGDTASYALLPGGVFASSPRTGWALNGASVVPGDEPWNVNGNSDDPVAEHPRGELCRHTQLLPHQPAAELALLRPGGRAVHGGRSSR